MANSAGSLKDHLSR